MFSSNYGYDGSQGLNYPLKATKQMKCPNSQMSLSQHHIQNTIHGKYFEGEFL